MLEDINKDLKQFYDKNLEAHGPGAQGVGWRNQEAQLIRFEQIAKLLPTRQQAFSLNDLGCGVGDFATFLENTGYTDFTYTGYDVLEEMVRLAREKHPDSRNREFMLIEHASQMHEAHFTIASGIFNLRYANTDEQWLTYIIHTLQEMNKKSHEGFAFNALTKYSDRDKMQDYLYYSDPLYLFDYCKRHFSRNVALLHDYNLYDFTIIVRKTLG
jgi:SAM-dependent methyltransferase